MTLERFHLDDVNRKCMLAELDGDEQKDGTPYISPRLSPEGMRIYPKRFERLLLTVTIRLSKMH